MERERDKRKGEGEKKERKRKRKKNDKDNDLASIITFSTTGYDKSRLMIMMAMKERGKIDKQRKRAKG